MVGTAQTAPLPTLRLNYFPFTILRQCCHAASIVGAIERTLGERTLRTRDLGGNADTTACGKAVAEMVE